MAVLRASRAPRLIALAIGALLALVAAHGSAGEATAREYQVKAAFLLNFARFVQWPAEAQGGDDQPLVIGILGNDPFGKVLEDTLRGETVRKHPLAVRRSQAPADLVGCAIVFVSDTAAAQADQIAAAFADRPILIVADSEPLLRRGAVIAFFMEGHKVHFAIDAAAGARRRLRFDPQLLTLGRVVDPPRGQE